MLTVQNLPPMLTTHDWRQDNVRLLAGLVLWAASPLGFAGTRLRFVESAGYSDSFVEGSLMSGRMPGAELLQPTTPRFVFRALSGERLARSERIPFSRGRPRSALFLFLSCIGGLHGI